MKISQMIPAMMMALLAASAAWADDAVRVVSGGVGGDERAAIEAQQADYSLKIILIGKGGMYLSDVAVSIHDASGAEVVNHTAEGPFVLADLPAGTYRLGFLAADGASQKLNVTIVEGQRREVHVRFLNTES